MPNNTARVSPSLQLLCGMLEMPHQETQVWVATHWRKRGVGSDDQCEDTTGPFSVSERLSPHRQVNVGQSEKANRKITANQVQKSWKVQKTCSGKLRSTKKLGAVRNFQSIVITVSCKYFGVCTFIQTPIFHSEDNILSFSQFFQPFNSCSLCSWLHLKSIWKVSN